MSTIFGKILSGEIPADRVYEDEHCVAFRDINPAAPVHVLVIPRKAIARLSAMTEDDEPLVGHLMRVATLVAKQQGLEDCRLVVNNGAGAGQTVFHLHVHVIGGRALHWPPG
ncbi:MAG: histidine triad nucleotide-binding protein [bacterium]|nr:histidine triad nucleotide-binding protein [Myxococcales bacterium]